MPLYLVVRSFVLALVLWLGVCGPSRAASGDGSGPLEIGITPYYSTRLLFQQFEPLRRYVEEVIGHRTLLVTAPDFRSFARRTHEGAYPFMFSVPHLGRLAEVDDGYRPLLQMKAALRGSFLVARESPVTSLADLRDRRVATPDSLAIITMMGEEALAQVGLVPGQGVTTVPKPSHNAAVLSVLAGETDAALVWHSTMASMERATAERLRSIGDTEELPIFILFMAAPRVPAAEVEAVRNAVLGFAATAEGHAFLAQTAYGGLGPVTSEELTPLDRYLPAVRRALSEPR